MTKSSKTPKIRTQIEANRLEISQLLSGPNTVKRLNNMYWIRRQLENDEPLALMPIKGKERNKYLDFSNMRNIGLAYDYILSNKNTPIDTIEIYKIHRILCEGTNISGGVLRNTNKILEISVDCQRYHAPDYSKIAPRLNEIVYNINDTTKDTLTRAFEAHYELIALQPFDDFNKRTSRLVMNWILINGGYRPIIFNKPSDADKYRNAIAAMAVGERKTYTHYMMQTLARSQFEIIKKIKESKIL